MPNYTKLFNSIVTSTIWTEDDKTRILWITMLAMSDQNGEVHASIPGLARIAGIDIAGTEKAIQAFLSPDPYSRTPDNEGRRIAKIDGGWELLNHAKYRLMASKEDSKASSAARVKRHRDRKAEAARKAESDCNATVTDCNATVTDCNASVTVGRDIAEAEAEAETKAEIRIPPNPQGGFGLEIQESKPSDPMPKGWQKMRAAERGLARVNFNTPQMLEFGNLMARKESTLWTVAEAAALMAVNPQPDEIELARKYYHAEIEKKDDYRRRDIITLLNHWNGELDRARIFTATNP